MNNQTEEKLKAKWLTIAGFVINTIGAIFVYGIFSSKIDFINGVCIFPIICLFGLLLSIYGLVKGEDDWQLLAIFGIVISVILLGFSAFLLLFMMFGVD